ncbi:MAG: response regulator [Arenicella sp.]
MVETIENSMAYQSLLLVEDDQRLASLVCEYMQNHGFAIQAESRGDIAVNTIIDSQPDLVILDLMLPGLDGLEVCRRVRPHYQGAIMMMTAQDEDVDQIVGLELGADDYVTKPVEPRVLLARVRTLLRRIAPDVTSKPKTERQEIVSGSLMINLLTRQAQLQRQDIRLTTGEFDLLWYLASNAGTVLSRDDLYQALCGIEYDGIDRAMDIRISRLRKLLGDDSDEPTRIKTVRGKGYLFVMDKA